MRINHAWQAFAGDRIYTLVVADSLCTTLNESSSYCADVQRSLAGWMY